MATSYRPEGNDSQDDQPTGIQPTRDADATANADTRMERTGNPAQADQTRDQPDISRTTVGSAAAPARAASADHAEATTRIQANHDPETTVDYGAQRADSVDYGAARDESLDGRRESAIQLGLARIRNRMSTDIGLLILRVMNLVMFLHGWAKLTGYSGFRESVAGNSFGALAPDLFAILVVAGQLALPIAIAVGFFTRISGLLQAVMMGIIWVLFPLAGGLIDGRTGGINGESAYLFVAIGLALFFTGPGRLSLDQVMFGKGAERRAARRAEKKLA